MQTDVLCHWELTGSMFSWCSCRCRLLASSHAESNCRAHQVRVIRNGREAGISTYDLLVGDVLVLATGDILPADGLLLKGSDLRWLGCRAAVAD